MFHSEARERGGCWIFAGGNWKLRGAVTKEGFQPCSIQQLPESRGIVESAQTILSGCVWKQGLPGPPSPLQPVDGEFILADARVNHGNLKGAVPHIGVELFELCGNFSCP
jgi:hypothetical protein